MRMLNNLHEKVELKKGPWTREEDQKLLAYIEEHGHGSWRSLPEKAGLERCGKSCRLRWTNYLRPDIKRGKFSSQEDKTIIRLHALLGNRWSSIATHMAQRTDNEIKNYWNTRLKKRLTRMGIDPVTHKPKNDPGAPTQSREAANLNHMTQWETARLEAEERLVRESKLSSRLRKDNVILPLIPPPPQMPGCLDVLKVWKATNQNGFFSLPGSLESPTSTLNFSPNGSTTVPICYGESFTQNDVVSDNNGSACGGGVLGGESSYGQVKGKMENSLLQPNDTLDYDYNISVPMEFVEFDNYGTCDFDEKRDNCWNELLNLVTSPMQSPVF